MDDHCAECSYVIMNILSNCLASTSPMILKLCPNLPTSFEAISDLISLFILPLLINYEYD